MKKLLTLSLIATVCTFQLVSAQLKKGEAMLGGTIGFNSSTSDAGTNTPENKSTTITIVPELGFGIGSNWVLGFGAGLAHNKQKSEDGFFIVEQSANVFTGSIFIRKAHHISERFGIFGQADAAYGGGKVEQTNGTNKLERDITSVGFSLKPGAYFRASRRFIIETSIGGIEYLETKIKRDGGTVESRNRSFDITLASSLNLSFRVVL
jgi:hypothetical protein